MDVSIILPVYNVEKYLKKCIESLINQKTSVTYEVILVDDGSTDKTAEICDFYEKNYEFIKVFHNKNQGVSEARNFGIKKATGSYLTFVDPDDYVSSNYIEKLYKQIVSNKDVEVSVVASIRVVEGYEDKVILTQKEEIIEVVDSVEALRKMFGRMGLGVAPWAKMYSAKLFEDIKFPKGRIYEDMLTMPYVFEIAKKISISNSQEYFYLARKGSITQSKISEEDYSIFEGLDKVCGYYERKYPQLKDAIQVRYLSDALIFINRLSMEGHRNSEIKKVRKYLNSKSNGYLKNNLMRTRIKLQVLVLNISINLYSQIVKRILSNREL